MNIFDITITNFRRQCDGLGLGGLKGMLKEIYETKQQMGSRMIAAQILDIERKETIVQKSIQMKYNLSEKEKAEFESFKKGMLNKRYGRYK